MIRETIGKFFVWTRTGHNPRHPHDDRGSAEAEAQRLALANPGKKFIVIQMFDKWHEPEDVEGLAEPVQGDPLKLAESQDA